MLFRVIADEAQSNFKDEVIILRVVVLVVNESTFNVAHLPLPSQGEK